MIAEGVLTVKSAYSLDQRSLMFKQQSWKRPTVSSTKTSRPSQALEGLDES